MCEKKSPLFRHVMSSAKVIAAQWTDDGRPILEEHDLSEAIACARGPDVLTTSEASRVAAAKAEGNRVFRSGDIDSALAAYNEALRVYSDRCGNAAQRLEKSKLLSNRAECLLRLNEWEAASRSASIAISLDAACAKARFRRARALCEIGGDSLEEALNELAELRRLRADGLHLINTRAESELQSRIVAQQEELRRIRHHDAKTLRTAFASGSAALSGDSDACSVWDDGSTRGSMDDPSLQWVSRLPANTHHAYLIDCYRTCVEDDMGSEVRCLPRTPPFLRTSRDDVNPMPMSM